MVERKVTAGRVVSESLIMSIFFAIPQIVGLIARLVFKVTYTGEQYGVFAFFLTTYLFFVSLNKLGLHVPIISAISKNPSDKVLYGRLSKQVLWTSSFFGIILAGAFMVWTTMVTGEPIVAAFFAVMLVIYSTSAVQHAFPRGRDQNRPAALASLLVGVLRAGLLVIFLIFLLDTGSLLLAAIVYSLPMIGWWIGYVRYEGIPRMKRPDSWNIATLYRDGFISYLLDLSVILPQFIGILTLTYLFGFEVAGNFDIALIPYTAASIILSGMTFTVINKARKFPDFRTSMRVMRRKVFLPIIAVSALGAVASIQLEGSIKSIITMVGFPDVIYWPVVILILLAIPAKLMVYGSSSFLQGRGIIRPVGIIAIGCAIIAIPFQLLLTWFLGTVGVAIALGLVNLAIFLLVTLYALRNE
jgi:O-antigen/teichoic acid export membrane protein